jgi:flagellar assembly protein FliH
MGAPAKFLFDVDFAAAGDRKHAQSAIPLAEHALKLAEAEAAAHEKGYADAQADAHRRMAEALERIAVNLTKATEALSAIETRLECEAVEVAVAVARKLAPTLIAREPFAEISALASDCFRELIAAPHIVVRVNEALYAPAREKLDEIVRAKSFQGRLVVLAEPDIAVGDCRIEWADGGISRDAVAADAVIGAAVASYISARRNLAAAAEMLKESRE